MIAETSINAVAFTIAQGWVVMPSVTISCQPVIFRLEPFVIRFLQSLKVHHLSARRVSSIRHTSDLHLSPSMCLRTICLSFLVNDAASDGAASLFRWSADGKYLARKGKDLISIYELPSMRLLDKKSLKVCPRERACETEKVDHE